MAFTAIMIWTGDILPSSAVTGEKGYVSQEEDTHVLIRERLHAFSIFHLDMMMTYQYGEHMINTEKR